MLFVLKSHLENQEIEMQVISNDEVYSYNPSALEVSVFVYLCEDGVR